MSPRPDGEPSRVVLVETSDALPGLLPFQAWDAIALADEVLARAPEGHPGVAHLHLAGVDVVELEPHTLDKADLDLSRPGSPDDRRLAKALLARVDAGAQPVYLLGPDDDGLAAALAGMIGDREVEIELVFFAPQPAGTEMLRLVEVMARLRDPDGGCPWDLEQDHQSLVRYLLEEAYEVVDAVEAGDDTDLVEELGDLLLQIVFHGQVARDRDVFTIDDVARGIVEKLVRRHPHVFGDGDASTAADVERRWEELKAEEKQRTGAFDGVPRSMPGLQMLDKLQSRAEKHDGRWRDDDPASRLRAAVAGVGALGEADGSVEAALGEVFAAAVSFARRQGIDPESAARRAASTLRDEVETSS